MCTNSLCYSGSNFYVCDMISVLNSKESFVASHLHCTDLVLQICCKCPCLTCIQKDGNYQGTEESLVHTLMFLSLQMVFNLARADVS